MADTELVELLKRGAEAFAAWRRERPSAELDLSDATLRAVVLDSIDLSQARLTRANLARANHCGQGCLSCSMPIIHRRHAESTVTDSSPPPYRS